MKCLSIFIVSLLFGFSIKAQTNTGIEAMYSEMYQTAKAIFIKQLSDSLARPEACYYLGETYRLTGNTDSASFYYELGSCGEFPNSLCMIGKAGLLMQTDPSKAEELIKKARWVKQYYKNPELYVAIATVCANNKNFALASEMLEIAKDFDKKYTAIYLTEGNILLQQKKPGAAAGKFETAILYDATCKSAYFKLAQINYNAKNYELSLSYIAKIRELDSQFSPTLKLLADISYEQGKYQNAVSFYTEYLQSPEAVLSDRIRFAYALFFNKEYQKSLDQIIQLLPHYPANQVLKRLQAYSLFEVGNYSEGLARMQDFLNSVEQSAIVPSDYKYHARLLSKNGQDSLSILVYKKAMAASSLPQEYYKEIASANEKAGNFGDAANYLEKYIKTAKKTSVSDFFNLGKDYYFAAGSIDSASIAKDTTQANVRKALYIKSDSIFNLVSSKSPDNYLGYFWRARVNAILDPETETGLAKPFYEKVVELLEPTAPKNLKELIESYQYLGYYYFIKDDFQKSKQNWNKILEIDSTNIVALKAIEGLK
jgi:tetratricopeptide (TPR) repeat protein